MKLKHYGPLSNFAFNFNLRPSTMAAKEGFVFRETLTGFKWLGRVVQLETG